MNKIIDCIFKLVNCCNCMLTRYINILKLHTRTALCSQIHSILLRIWSRIHENQSSMLITADCTITSRFLSLSLWIIIDIICKNNILEAAICSNIELLHHTVSYILQDCKNWQILYIQPWGIDWFCYIWDAVTISRTRNCMLWPILRWNFLKIICCSCMQFSNCFKMFFKLTLASSFYDLLK